MMKNLKKITSDMLKVFILLILSAGVYSVALKYPLTKEMSSYQLSETTQTLLKQFHQPLEITLYSQDSDTHHLVNMLVERYQRLQPQIHFQWHHQTLNQPPLPQHALIIQFENVKEIIDLDKVTINENQLTNALFKCQRKPNQWVVFLQGHNEPSPFGTKNNDFSLFRLSLENQGLKIQRLNLSQTPIIPDNTQVLIIASPQSSLLPTEEALITEYVAKGKDLLWLSDPASYTMPLLSQHLGIFPLPGTIHDWHGQKLGTPHPAITIIDKYPSIPFDAPNTLTAFPWARALEQKKRTDFIMQPLLITHNATWTQTETFHKSPSEQSLELPGPLLLGVSLTRMFQDNQQRVVVIGNSRFLSNGAIENYGNLALGLNLINWLSHDDALLHISQPVAKDTMLHIHAIAAIAIQYGYPILGIFLFIFSMIFTYSRVKRSQRIASKLSLT